MTLATLTDYERASLLRRICATFGLNYDACSEGELLVAIAKDRENAEKYVDLCR